MHAAALFCGGPLVEALEPVPRIRPAVPRARQSDEVGLVVW